MEERYFSLLTNPKYDIKSLSLEELKTRCLEFNIKYIGIDEKVTFQKSTSKDHFMYNDSNHPITFTDKGLLINNLLSIEGNYFKEHRDQVIDALCYVVKNIKNTSISIEADFVTDNLLYAIKENENLKEISLGSKEKPIVFDKKLYDLFKDTDKIIKTNDVSEEFKNCFESVVGCNSTKSLIGYKTYNDIINTKELSFRKFNEEEAQYFKFVPDNVEIDFFDASYDDVYKIIMSFRECGKKPKYKINVKDKNKFNAIFLEQVENLSDENIEVSIKLDNYSLSKYAEYENRLIDMIRPAFNLSPFERFLYAYNVVKKYKQYKENEDDKSSARNVYQLLDNEYMVCVGYSELLGDLLDKLGIENDAYSVNVDVGLDDFSNDVEVQPENQEINLRDGGHARRIINLCDPKYGIDGIFISDPTWDNVMDNDSYVYSLMNLDEYTGVHSYSQFYTYLTNELLMCKSLEEFYEKFNLILDREEYNAIQKQKEKRNDEINKLLVEKGELTDSEILLDSDSEEFSKKRNDALDKYRDLIKEIDKKNQESYKPVSTVAAMTSLLRKLINNIEKFDKKFYISFIEKYPVMNSYSADVDYKMLQDMLLFVGEHIVSKSNTFISGNTYKDAITVLYRDCYGLREEELEEKLNEIMAYNKARREICFPLRYKISQDGEKIPYINETNKFDIEETVINSL